MSRLPKLAGRSRADLIRTARRRGRLAMARTQAWRSPRHAARHLVQLQPAPLIDPDRRIVLIWTAKVASSTAAIWFFEGVGRRHAAEQFNHNPHEYRQKLHYNSRLHQRALASDLTDFKVLRIVRDPWTRAVSSYRHSIWVGYHNAALADRLERPVGGKRGYSFLDYLDFLEDIDLRTANLHDRLQRHPVEDVLIPSAVVRLPDDDLFLCLGRFERENGLPITDLSGIEWIERVERPRRAGRGEATRKGPDVPLTRAEAARQGPWPETASFLTDDVRQRISDLYAVDVEAYFG